MGGGGAAQAVDASATKRSQETIFLLLNMRKQRSPVKTLRENYQTALSCHNFFLEKGQTGRGGFLVTYILFVEFVCCVSLLKFLFGILIELQ